MERKRRIGFVTSNPLFRTGFSNNIKTILPILYQKDKYELFHLCQATPDGDPNFLRFPWKSEGVFKQGTFDLDLFQRDPGYNRRVAYGNLVVEKFVVDNKLDCLIHIEDGWSSEPQHYYENKTWWPYFKNNFLQWTTIDSLPPLDIYRQWPKECPNVWFWSSFGARALKEEDPEVYKNVKTVFGVLNQKEYSLLSPVRKMELRQKFNIPQNTKLFIQLGRNQLRKLFPFAIEALGKFKKRNPEHKAKLLFHCSWNEPNGWPLEKLIKDFGLEKDDVLTTYACQRCHEYEIKPFVGENQNCPYCQTEKSQITAGIASGISNERLSEIYGIADASLSIYTSGGFEYTNYQSLLCGLPLLCTEYSSGEDFVNNGIVYKLDGNHTFESGTGFIKHAPNVNTIFKFFKTICEMPETKRREIGSKGRAWALEAFDTNKTIEALENFINNCPPIEWDYKVIPYDEKNPNAQIPEIEENGEWLKVLYKKILNMDVDNQDSGWNYWMEEMKKGMKREDIEKYFRYRANEDNAKNIKIEDLFDKDDEGKRILYVIPESIGDCYLSTSLFESIHETYPNHHLYVATKPDYFPVFEGVPHVHKTIPYLSDMENEMQMIGFGSHKGYVDICLLPHIQTQRQLNYLSDRKISFNIKK